MKKLVIKILILILPAGLSAQELSGLRERVFRADSDTVILDRARIVPGTIGLSTESGQPVSDTLYTADPLNSLLIFDEGFPYRGKTLTARYRVFTLDPAMAASRKDTAIIIPAGRDAGFPHLQRYSSPAITGDLWKEESLTRSGSISRGVTFGNNQDVIVNSNLNLQLSGRLDDNLNITASISDQNIPLQPEGYSQQIHEFDKIFIRIGNERLSLTAGDFEVRNTGGRFLPVDRKGQGIQFSVATEPGSGPFTEVSTTASAAISKGRYHSNSFTGQEGNQGPYKLRGANNELFIIVLAGTERIYVDGRLLTRGVDNDYVIDYNLAEITFTPDMPVTKDRRIIAEFEYSDKNYARFMVSNTTALSTGRGNYFVNIFSGHDARNQPLMQELKEEEKELLATIGDSLHRAWVPKIDSVEFRNDIVLYEKADTIAGGRSYTIYKYSTDPVRAHYRLSFSFVGENRGSYIPAVSSANGRVFRWVAPINGTPQGSHEPVMLLVTPVKHQVISMGGSSSLAPGTEAFFELAVSNFDRNTFSALDNDDNMGMALRIGIDNSFFPFGDDNALVAGADYEFSGIRFAPTERYRPVEHERDWNLVGDTGPSDEHRVSWYADYNRGAGDFASYRGEYLSLAGEYSGLRNRLEAGTPLAGFDSRLMLSYLSSDGRALSTGFLRHAAEISRPLWIFRVGLRTEGEHNVIEEKGSGLLSAESFSFLQREIFLRNSDTATLHFFTAYRERDDKLSRTGSLEPSSFARELSSGFRSSPGRGNHFAGTINYRRLKPERAVEQTAGPENSLSGRLESRLRLLGGSIQSSGFYETGAGLETRREFLFVEVARGQGTHTWTDYNENGIRELDEFEPAAFPDQANYIRIFIPSDDFIRTRSSQFSQRVQINPPANWRDGSGLKRVLSLFSNQSAYQTGQKIAHAGLLTGINPFHRHLADTSLISVSSSFRNTLSFQRTNRRFGMEYLHRSSRSKSLLANGFDTRQMRADALYSRLEAAPAVIVSNRTEKGSRIYRSEYFPGRDHDIRSVSSEMAVTVQPGYTLQSSLHLKWTALENHPGNEKAQQYNLGTEIRYTIHSKGNISVRADYFHVRYNASANTPLAWEMLGGLKPGNNMTMMVQLQQNLTGSLQMSLNYNGRSVPGSSFIHTGGMQMIAFF